MNCNCVTGNPDTVAARKCCDREGESRLPGNRAAPQKGDSAVMPMIPRRDILARFRDMVQRGIPIVGGGAGTGLSAKCEEAGGIDLIIIYNSGRYRMAGRGSAAGLLAYGNANEIVKEMAREVLPVVKHTPVLAGVNGTDPFVLMPQFLAELKGLGFSGVQNFPTVGLFDGDHAPELRGDRHGLWPRGRHDPPGQRARPPHHALRLQSGRGGRDGQGRRRRHRRPYGRHHRRLDRRHLGEEPRYVCRRDRGDRRSRARRAARTSSSSAMAGRSRCRTMPSTSSSAAVPATGSTARRAWNGCRSRSR